MAEAPVQQRRSIGLAGATGIGVGAIVGGGILALAGVAFAQTGPGAVLAFGANGIIAIITALSFAEMATRFPESGGTYAFARRVLPIEAAFAVGWIVWFASIVASVLYAIGFAAFAMAIWQHVAASTAWVEPAWLMGRPAEIALAIGATVVFATLLTRYTGGGQWINVIKVAVFGVLIVGGLWALVRVPVSETADALRPFLPHGGLGLITAMGFTFIALQGFDLIAAVAGEIDDPRRNVPRSMLLSLGIALGIYLPLLVVISTVGTPAGRTIGEMAAEDPEQVVAIAALEFLGPTGYWMVLIAGVPAMLTALQANLLASSRIALAMARDRTLPEVLERVHPQRGVPIPAIVVTTALVVLTVAVVPDVAAAGAAASLVFLITFALVHVIVLIARHRAGISPDAFRVPLAPALPALGALACGGLAVFQAVAVPSAGAVIVTWTGLGGVIFIAVFARRARVRDATSEALNPELLKLRGRSPLVLVPIANPAHAPSMVTLANVLTPPGVGRTLLLSIIDADEFTRTDEDIERPLGTVHDVYREALGASRGIGLAPQMLTTIAPRRWSEIVRIARTYRCTALLMGLGDPAGEMGGSGPLEEVMRDVGCNTVILRAPSAWRVDEVEHVLVPIGGRGDHQALRARLISHLRRTGKRDIRYVHIIKPDEFPQRRIRFERELRRLAADESRGVATAEVIMAEDPLSRLAEEAAACDLVILGTAGSARNRTLGAVVRRIARETTAPLIIINSVR